jgi:hypothetical protein
MAHLALYSFSPGTTPEQQQSLISGKRQPEEVAKPLAAEPEEEAAPADAPAEAAPIKPRRRARTASGTFQADDPATPAVNEAYEPEPEPGKLQQ